MYSLVFATAALLLPSVAARRIGGGVSGDVTIGFHFDAPPLEDANLAAYAILLIATLALLGLAISGLFRARSGHHLPGVGIGLALAFMAIEYALSIALVVGEYSFDDFGDFSLSRLTVNMINAATSFFWDWVDPMMFAAVAIVLRDRYLTHAKTNKDIPKRVLPLLPFTIASCIFFASMFILSTASVAMFVAASNAFQNGDILPLTFSARVHAANDVFYTFIAIDFLATVFLIAFAIVVKKLTKTDKISTFTLTIIMPLLTLRIISRVIFTILNSRLPLSTSYTEETAEALDFSSTLLYGIFHLAAVAVLVYFLMAPGMWDGSGTGAGPGGYNAPQYGPQYGPGVPQYGPGVPQYAPGPHGGYQPQAMFPGQWGYTGQPQQYGYPIVGYPPPGQGPVPYYPNQQPQASPGEEKTSDGAPHPYANQGQTPPPPPATP